MKATQHPSNNRVLGAPSGWDHTALPCDELPVTVGQWDGLPTVTSYWLPTKEELALLQQGSPVSLVLIGDTMPPALMHVVE